MCACADGVSGAAGGSQDGECAEWIVGSFDGSAGDRGGGGTSGVDLVFV